jgi:hypothetical protein
MFRGHPKCQGNKNFFARKWAPESRFGWKGEIFGLTYPENAAQWAAKKKYYKGGS